MNRIPAKTKVSVSQYRGPRREISWVLLATAVMSLSLFMMACGSSPADQVGYSLATSDTILDSNLQGQELASVSEALQGMWTLAAADGEAISEIRRFDLSIDNEAPLCSAAIELRWLQHKFTEKASPSRCMVHLTRESELSRHDFRRLLRTYKEARLLQGRLLLSNDEHIFVFEKSTSN